MTAMHFPDAAALDIANASTAELTAAWHAYAGRISFHHADDSGSEWVLVGPLAARARLIEVELRNRSAERPSGEYLMTMGERIDWETGEWSPGWHWKKAKAAKVAA
jgi:hypothetical protein